MGRRHLIRALLLIAGTLAAAATAAAATGVKWTVVTHGATEPSGRQAPVGYISTTRAQEQKWAPRLAVRDRSTVGKLALESRVLVAAFLDGLPCSTNVATTGVTRSGATLTVKIAFTRPPIGMATCIRTSTPYVVLSVPRASLGKPAPTHVDVIARARA